MSDEGERQLIGERERLRLSGVRGTGPYELLSLLTSALSPCNAVSAAVRVQKIDANLEEAMAGRDGDPLPVVRAN